MIYLDNAATTKILPRVWNTMQPYFTRFYGNPDSPHLLGKEAREAVEMARVSVARMIGANSGRVIFTSGGTESNNMVFNLAKNHMVNTVITSSTEHKSVLEPARMSGAPSIRFMKPGKKGYISADDLFPGEIPNGTLLSLMYMNNETGMINDVYRIGQRLRQYENADIFFHVDCVQAAGSARINVEEMGADMVSISSHKIHGPKGVGCLWVSDRVLERIGDPKSLSVVSGGGQEQGFRAGTLNVSGIVGFGKAAEIASGTGFEIFDEFASHFVEELNKHCDDQSITYKVNWLSDVMHCNKVLSITFPMADAETVVLIASRNGLCISAGAACNSESSEPSYVLTNSGIKEDLARATVRVSFSRYNSYADVTQGAKILADTVSEVLRLNLTDAVV